MKDLILDSTHDLKIEPLELQDNFIEVLKVSLVKDLSADAGKPWSEDNETEFQEKLSSFLARANDKGIGTIKLIITSIEGAIQTRELSIDKIRRTRVLQ